MAYFKSPETSDIELTEDQQAALKEIKRWYDEDEDKPFKVLSGYAGTGKTVLLDFIVKDVPSSQYSCAVTATTNKAVKVLKDKVSCPNMSTVHSLLNIKPKQKGTQEIFEPVTWDKQNINRYDLVIVDECSMISKKLLAIIEEQIEPGTKVLFCGDPAQLQPINETISKCFSYDPVTLTEVVRHGDVIANKSKLVRETSDLINPMNLLEEPDILKANNDTIQMFSDWKSNVDKVRLLCWTNDRVEYWNRYLRKVDWGEELDDPYVPGDILIANEAIQKDKNIIMLNSEEGVVKEVKEDQEGYNITLKKFSGGQATVKVVRDEYKDRLNSTLKDLARRAKSNGKLWGKYWALRKSFHDVRHAYALTTHKSQGSTFENVIIDTLNITRNRDIQERNQLLYVAMTRASDKVYLYG